MRPIRQLGGGHHFNEVELNEVFVPDDHLLGTPGEGWRQVTSELAWERQRTRTLPQHVPALQRGRRRLPGTVRDSPRPRPGDRRHAGATVDDASPVAARGGGPRRGETPAVAAALVKDLGTTLENDIIDAVAPLCDSEPELTALFREAVLAQPGFTLRGGSTEVLRGIVAREVTRR